MRIALLLCILAAPLAAQSPTVASYVVSRIAGAPQLRVDGAAASDAMLQRPFSVAQDRLGNIYISDANGISMVTPAGLFRVVTGINRRGVVNTAVLGSDPLGEVLVGDGTQLSRRFSNGTQTPIATLSCVSALTSDRSGNIYASCQTAGVVYRISATGSVTVFAGTLIPGSSGDGGQATAAQISPTHLAIDAAGNLYIFDTASMAVRRVTADGIIRTVAGGGTSSVDGVSALSAQLAPVGGMAVDSLGNICVSEPSAHRIRRFTVGSTISIFAGSSNSPGDSVDGGQLGSARFNEPNGLFTDRDGNILIADTGNHRVRKATGGFLGTITAVAGTSHFRGDGGRAIDALLNNPAGVALDSNGNVLIADTQNFRVRRVSLTGIITTVAGSGLWGFGSDQPQATATTALIKTPVSVVGDRQGGFYFSDVGNDRIRRVTAAGVISTAASLLNPGPLVLDPSGNLLFAQTTRVIGFSPTGTVSALAGSIDAGFSGDGGPALSARFTNITGLAVDGQGNIYISDDATHTVRRVGSNGIVQTIAGTGQRAGFSGDGGPAASALLDRPKALAIDFNGNLFIADRAGTLIRRIATDGTIRTVAGSTAPTADGLLAGQALNAAFSQITALAVDGNGQVFFADPGSGAVGKLTPQTPAKVTYVSGDNQTGGTDSQLVDPLVVRLTDTDGVPVAGVPVDFYVVSGIAYPVTPTAVTNLDGTAAMTITLGPNPGAVRMAASTLGLLPVTFNITIIPRTGSGPPTGTNYTVITYAGMPFPNDDGAILRAPDSIAVDGDGTVYFSDSSTHRILKRPRDGNVTLFAGTGVRGAGTNREFAYNVRLSNPTGVAVGPNSSVYFADRDNNRICRVTGDGVFEVALDKGLNAPIALTLDPAGQVYIADNGSSYIRLLLSDGTVANIAGTGTAGTTEDGQPAAQSAIGRVTSLALDSQGILYFVEDNHVRKITPDGLLATVGDATLVGNAIAFDGAGSLYIAAQSQIVRIGPDGGITALADGAVSSPLGVAIENTGAVWIADTGDQLIRRVDPAGLVETITGKTAPLGDGGQSVLTILDTPTGLAVDASGTLYIADATYRRVRRVTTDGIIQTVAAQATFTQPRLVAVDARNTLYVVDENRIRTVDSSGTVSAVTLASPDTVTTLRCLTVSPTGDLVVCNGNTVQRLLPTGVLEPIAGNPGQGFGGDGAAAVFALLNAPQSVVYDSNGNIYIADRGNLRVRKIANGIISTVAGTGKRNAFAVEGVPALQADLDDVVAVAVDAQGNLYIAEANRIRKVSPSGIIATIAGSGSYGFDAESGAGLDAQFDGITSMVIDASGNLFVSDTNNHRVRKLSLLN